MDSSCLVYILLAIATCGIALFIDNREFAFGGSRYSGKIGPLTNGRVRNFFAEFGIFALLFGVSACRIAVGNDYWPYRENFKLIAQQRDVASEAGFNAIIRLMQSIFGYDNYLPIFALFSFLTVLFFCLALKSQAKYYAFSLFLLLTGGYYYNSLNSVRYYLALAIALFAMQYVLRGDYLRFLFWVLIGVNFHKSILLIVPVYLFAKWASGWDFSKWKKWHWILGGGVLTAFLGSLVFCQGLYRKLIFTFYPFYEGSMFDNGSISYVNIAKCVAVLALCLICLKSGLKGDRTNRFYCILNGLGLVVYCCGSFIPETSRIGYYMIVSQVFLLPRLLMGMKKGWLKTLCTVGVIVAFTAYFGVMLYQMYAKDIRLLPYLSWIFD